MEQFSEKKQSVLHKNSKLRNFMLQMDGLKDRMLDSMFLSKLLLEKNTPWEEETVTPEM